MSVFGPLLIFVYFNVVTWISVIFLFRAGNPRFHVLRQKGRIQEFQIKIMFSSESETFFGCKPFNAEIAEGDTRKGRFLKSC